MPASPRGGETQAAPGDRRTPTRGRRARGFGRSGHTCLLEKARTPAFSGTRPGALTTHTQVCANARPLPPRQLITRGALRRPPFVHSTSIYGAVTCQGRNALPRQAPSSLLIHAPAPSTRRKLMRGPEATPRERPGLFGPHTLNQCPRPHISLSLCFAQEKCMPPLSLQIYLVVGFKLEGESAFLSIIHSANSSRAPTSHRAPEITCQE